MNRLRSEHTLRNPYESKKSLILITYKKYENNESI